VSGKGRGRVRHLLSLVKAFTVSGLAHLPLEVVHIILKLHSWVDVGVTHLGSGNGGSKSVHCSLLKLDGVVKS